jgi:hypothetical protein
MTPAERDQTAEIRTVLARQGIPVDDDDLAAIVKTVAASRAGLARALAAVSGSPEVPHGFVPPAPPADAAPDNGR